MSSTTAAKAIASSTAGIIVIESTNSAVRATSGTPLRDSYHLGSTIKWLRFLGDDSSCMPVTSSKPSPSAAGYPIVLAQELSNLDAIDFINPATGVP